MGYQISIDRETHLANMASRDAAKPVCVLIAVGPDETELWRRPVHQVRCLKPSWSEYGWGEERAHSRGQRFGASIWFYTEGPVEFLGEDGEWHTAR